MDGRVQIVDQLRADDGLCENQLNRGERVACVVVKHRKECVVSLGRLKAFLFNQPLRSSLPDQTSLSRHGPNIRGSVRRTSCFRHWEDLVPRRPA